MDQEVLRDRLRQVGYGNVSEETLDEFAKFLEREPTTAKVPTPEMQPKRPKKKVKKTSKRLKKSSIDPDTEEANWTGRLRQLQQKAMALDLQLEACTDICEEEKRSSSGPPLYRFNFENYKDPDPIVAKSAGGKGYIKPPKHVCTRMRFPIYKRDVCYPPPDFVRQMRELEKLPKPYVPDEKNRQDELRWRLRERMRYSHPDYHI